MTTRTLLAIVGLAALVIVPVVGQTPASAPRTTTRDIEFKSHDGHAMLGRLSLPDTPGHHPVLVFVQNAEASTLDQRTRNTKGEPVPFFDLYRENLAPLNVGFFSTKDAASTPIRPRMASAAPITSRMDGRPPDTPRSSTSSRAS